MCKSQEQINVPAALMHQFSGISVKDAQNQVAQANQMNKDTCGHALWTDHIDRWRPPELASEPAPPSLLV